MPLQGPFPKNNGGDGAERSSAKRFAEDYFRLRCCAAESSQALESIKTHCSKSIAQSATFMSRASATLEDEERCLSATGAAG
jgi:hypothetical protein